MTHTAFAFFQNLSTFKNLKILSLQSNRITKMENLEELESLEELYLSHNGLTKLEGLEKNVSATKSYSISTTQNHAVHIAQFEDAGCRREPN
jgi:Leucine-rich repeat (LRR) protein